MLHYLIPKQWYQWISLTFYYSYIVFNICNSAPYRERHEGDQGFILHKQSPDEFLLYLMSTCFENEPSENNIYFRMLNLSIDDSQ